MRGRLRRDAPSGASETRQDTEPGPHPRTRGGAGGRGRISGSRAGGVGKLQSPGRASSEALPLRGVAPAALADRDALAVTGRPCRSTTSAPALVGAAEPSTVLRRGRRQDLAASAPARSDPGRGVAWSSSPTPLRGAPQRRARDPPRGAAQPHQPDFESLEFGHSLCAIDLDDDLSRTRDRGSSVRRGLRLGVGVGDRGPAASGSDDPAAGDAPRGTRSRHVSPRPRGGRPDDLVVAAPQADLDGVRRGALLAFASGGGRRSASSGRPAGGRPIRVRARGGRPAAGRPAEPGRQRAGREPRRRGRGGPGVGLSARRRAASGRTSASTGRPTPRALSVRRCPGDARPAAGGGRSGDRSRGTTGRGPRALRRPLSAPRSSARARPRARCAARRAASPSSTSQARPSWTWWRRSGGPRPRGGCPERRLGLGRPRRRPAVAAGPRGWRSALGADPLTALGVGGLHAPARQRSLLRPGGTRPSGQPRADHPLRASSALNPADLACEPAGMRSTARLLLLLALASCVTRPRLRQGRAWASPSRQPSGGGGVVACGRLFHVGVPVVLWSDPGGYDAYSTSLHFDAPSEEVRSRRESSATSLAVASTGAGSTR